MLPIRPEHLTKLDQKRMNTSYTRLRQRVCCVVLEWCYFITLRRITVGNIHCSIAATYCIIVLFLTVPGWSLAQQPLSSDAQLNISGLLGFYRRHAPRAQVG